MPAYIRPTIFLSVIIGLVLGILLTVPIIQLFVIFLFFIFGAGVIYMLKRNSFMENFSQKEGIIIGGISGFVSVFAAALSFLVFALLEGMIFNGAYSMIRAFFGSFSSFIVLLIFLVCIAIMNMVFNMGSALLIVAFFENKKQSASAFKLKTEGK